MTRLILAIAFLLVTSPAQAWMGVTMVGGGGGAATCGDQFTNTDGSLSCNLGYTKEYEAASITTVGALTVYRVSVQLKKIGTPAGNITLKICTDSSSHPSTTCTAADATQAESGLTTDFAWYEFTRAAGWALDATTV